jgi:uncharacterized caspase-like protein
MDDWALIVGINRYPRAGVDPLVGAVGDAERFKDWVTSPLGGNITDPDRVKMLTSPTDGQDNQVATPAFDEIYKYFMSLRSAIITRGDPGRRLYIFLSGHGISAKGQQDALLMATAMQPNLWDNFAGNLWAEGIAQAALFHEVVLFMDCCRDLQNSATVVDHIFGPPTSDSKNSILVAAHATQWASKARELDLPPDVSEQSKTKRGVFTYSVLEVLNSGRMNGTMFKTAVKAHLTRTLKDEKKPQETEIRGEPEDKALERIVFNEGAQEPRIPVRILGLTERPRILVYPEGSDDAVPVPVDGWIHQLDAWEGYLTPGQYDLWLPTGSTKRLKVFPANPLEIRVQP